MALDKDRIHELVEIFYQKPPFKTFYVNSTDGETFVKPTGVFVSLGITTSMKTLEDLRDILSKTPGIKSSIVEIESVKVAGTFMNHIINTNPTQYEVDPETVKPNTVLTKEETEEELKSLEKIGKRDEATKLKDAITRVQESPEPWTTHSVMKLESGGYRVFHRYVNYKKSDDTEYRLGIYVEENT
jgi:hypothetical protein